MRRTTCLLATAALLAMFCGCQSMPTLAQPEGPLPPVDTGEVMVPEPIPNAEGESAVVEDPEAQMIPEPEAPEVLGQEGIVYGQAGDCASGCGHGCQGYGCRRYCPHGLHARNMHHTFRGPHGPPTGQVTYPYYTIRGPRDFLMDNPPSIGP